MRKFFKFLSSRMFLVSLILLIEVIAICLLVIYVQEKFAWLYLIMLLLGIALMIFVISVKGNNSYKMTWLFIIGALPIFGPLAYLLFGNKKFTKRQIGKVKPIISNLKKVIYDTKAVPYVNKENQDVARMMQYIQKVTDIPPFGETDVTYFPLGDDCWPVMVEELKKAKHYIFFEYFIISKGKMWDSILNILKEKAAAGVDVRVMYDDFGSITTVPSNLPKQLEQFGIKCFAYNRYRPIVNVKMNNRDHRKILVIDGHTGFTGGINIADEYVNKKLRFGHWKDNAIMLKGEGVFAMTVLFLSMWDAHYEIEEHYFDYRYEKHASELGYVPEDKGFVQTYGDIPFDDEAISQSVYVNILTRAHKYVYITTPYLIPSSEIEFALVNAAKQGINVVLLTPHIPDKKVVFSVTRSYYRPLLEAGVKIYEYTPGFVHSKMFVCDDIIGTVGTSNLDYRSLFLHLETVTLMYNSPAILDMKKDFEESIKVSEEWTLEKFKSTSVFKRMWWAILKVFAPLM